MAKISSTMFSSPLPSFHLSLSFYLTIFLCVCHQNYIKQHIFSSFPSFFLSCLFLCNCVSSEWCQNRNVFPLIFSPVTRFAAIKTRTFSKCFMSSLSLSFLTLCRLHCILSLSHLSPLLYHPRCNLSLSPSIFLSSSLYALCHSPLSPFHKSICWPTGCVTDSVL